MSGSGRALHRVGGHVCAGTEGGKGIPVKHLGKLLIIPHFNFLLLVRGTETVKEVRKGRLPLRKQVSNSLSPLLPRLLDSIA